MTAIPALASARPPAIALAGLPEPAHAEVAACLAARGLGRTRSCDPTSLTDAIADGEVGALWIEPSPGSAATLAAASHAAAAAGRPLVIFARPTRGKPIELAAALAYLRAHGAVVCADLDAWLEAVCLIAWYGLPHGPRAAIVAPPGSWVAIAAAGLGADDLEGRRPVLTSDAGELAVDLALVADWSTVPARPSTSTLLVPLCPRGERVDAAPPGALVGLRAALAAITATGRAAERARAGLGPAGRSARAELDVDHERIERQLAKINAGDTRLGDHETKVLLAAYGVAITRQAVATTASAALRVARKAGFPVDLKRWGGDVPLERDGAVVEAGVATAADVRRAYAAVLGHTGPGAAEVSDGAVIVRESPPAGREVAASIVSLGPLGWTVVLEAAGVAPSAAPAPLRAIDAQALAQALVASRAGDDEPDRAALAGLLRRASHLIVDHGDRLARLDLGRIVVGGRGGQTLVVDAAAELRRG